MSDINSIDNKILDIDFGNRKVAGAVGIDFNNSLSANVIHNLNQIL